MADELGVTENLARRGLDLLAIGEKAKAILRDLQSAEALVLATLGEDEISTNFRAKYLYAAQAGQGLLLGIDLAMQQGTTGISETQQGFNNAESENLDLTNTLRR